MIVTVVLGVVLWKIHKIFHKNGVYDNDVYEIAAPTGMFVGVIAFLILTVASIVSIGDTVTLLFNPEYWALNKILSAIK